MFSLANPSRRHARHVPPSYVRTNMRPLEVPVRIVRTCLPAVLLYLVYSKMPFVAATPSGQVPVVDESTRYCSLLTAVWSSRLDRVGALLLILMPPSATAAALAAAAALADPAAAASLAAAATSLAAASSAYPSA